MPAYEDITDEEFRGDHVAAEIARVNRRRVEGNKLVHPSFRYQEALKEIQARKQRELLSAQFSRGA